MEGTTTDTQGAKTRKSSERAVFRSRHSSLRRVKDSTNVLREKSLQRQRSKKDAISGSPAGRDGKGRQFTVANVGNNGMIYLRPVQKAQPQPGQQPSTSTAPSTLQTEPSSYMTLDASAQSQGQGRDSVWTRTSTPTHASTTPTSLANRDIPNVEHRYSGYPGDHQSLGGQSGTGTLKIVIDRTDTAETTTDQTNETFPSLEVPIPHYRLGTPRFSAKGTAFLHQSVYTRSSIGGDFFDQDLPLMSGGEYGHLLPRPSGIEAHAVLSRRHSLSSPQPYSIQTSFPHPAYISSDQPINQGLPISRPVSPHVFDTLALNPEDPAIVKYSPINGDIIAATPARIIAQITSENFLDYELLSDFFLTVRAYISTHDLLSLLLARFEWAINRFDDNGRVIRVRAFAALRHWILNYFSYDFVMDRELRVKFCERLNDLAKLVKERAEYGMSDLKLIADLKKCWNGRCSLYWDSPSLSGEGLQDVDIQPGGIVGSRDSQLVHQSQLRYRPVAPQPGLSHAQLTSGSTSIANWYSAVMEHSDRAGQGHARQTSTTTSRSLPISPSSEQSVPILSCSIPAKSFKRAYPYANKALAIHPVPVSAPSKRSYPFAPSAFSRETPALVGEHRRSGSFSDAARDKRAPLSSEIPSGTECFGQDATVSDRSLLRGYLPPGGPYVSAVASTPAAEVSHLALGHSHAGVHEPSSGRKHGSTHGPAVKGLFGNIRRALSSRHAGANVSFPTGSSIGVAAVPPTLPSLGRSASVPLNVMFQATTSGQLQSYRSIRVDLLAAEIYDSFCQAQAARETIEVPLYEPTNSIPFKEQAQMTPSNGIQNLANEQVGQHLQPPEFKRLNSAMTDSSQSILIVDDTGLNIPGIVSLSKTDDTHSNPTADANCGVDISSDAPSGNLSSQTYSADQKPLVRRASVASYSDPQNATESRLPGSTFPIPGSLKSAKYQSHDKSHPNAASLRRYASYQSTFTRQSGSRSIDARSTKSTSKLNSKKASENGPTRMLRRRPGGNLRANQNVHDLELPARPRSAGSVTTYTDSMRESEGLGFGEKITRTFNARKTVRERSERGPAIATSMDLKQQSIEHTHSSQPTKRRPSFEAAVAQFARIPDDDEGGIEATLLKLEGRYKSPLQSPDPRRMPDQTSSEERTSSVQSSSVASTSTNRQSNNRRSMLDEAQLSTNLPTHNATLSNEAREQLTSTLYAGSDDSYNSVPLLERGIGTESDVRPEGSSQWPLEDHIRTEQRSSGEIVQETPSLRRLRHGSVAPTTTTDSFLLDENDEFLSEASSDISMETLEAESAPWPLPGTNRGDEEMVVIVQNHPPSPPMTIDNASSNQSHTDRLHQQQKPPTPDPSPVSLRVEPSSVEPNKPRKAPAHPRHMPFILGYESEILAQQFTLVEKDALKEVDWRDLVDMRWQNTATSTTNWVEYLHTQDPLGIDLVTARFNIMVKWALSEIVLTENIEERALTIVKYIHIAQQSRKLNNYATLLQLTIALTSADCTRLSKTWNLVPEKEKDILQDLEMLVSPRRNFQNLRLEMEKANAEHGCIPVVALYIHDLTYNAQKPSQVPGILNGEPLVNFERYRSTAVIVKSLLRLIDASTKYDFAPIEGIIERCLWMACLTDEMITHKSKQQEYNAT